MMQKRVYIDMDGVLCEYKENATLEEMKTDGYFRSLSPRAATVEAVKYLIRSKFAEVFILSSVFPERVSQASAEKNEWIDKYLPEIKHDHRIFTLCGKSKAEFLGSVNAGDILCDDYSKNLAAWTHAGGSAIKILNEVNGKGGTFTEGLRLDITSKEDLLGAVLSIA